MCFELRACSKPRVYYPNKLKQLTRANFSEHFTVSNEISHVYYFITLRSRRPVQQNMTYFVSLPSKKKAFHEISYSADEMYKAILC